MNKFLKITGTILFLASAAPKAFAQNTDTSSDGNDLAKLLSDDDKKPKKEFVTATFKGTRVINGQSNEGLGKGTLSFLIQHRFGEWNTGVKDFFGLDNANTRIGFDYGITDWLMVGIGRSSYQKEYDGYFKVKILRQTTDNSMPISLSYAGSISTHTDDVALDSGEVYKYSNRVAYSSQIIIARKFNDRLSLQLTPAHVHYNLVNETTDHNDLFAIGVGGRIKLSHRIALTGDWFYRIPGTGITSQGYRNSLSVGIDIETGGHVFQLHFSNSTGMTDRTFMGETIDDWGHNQIHFGFNISRVFTIVKPKDFRGSKSW